MRMSRMGLREGLAAFCLAFALVGTLPAVAEKAPGTFTREQRDNELREAWRAGGRAAVRGPSTASLGAQGSFQVSDTHLFIPVPEATRIFRALGNSPGSSLFGIVTSERDEESWIATINFRKEGYIRDDDAKEWNADELLDNLKAGTENSNEERRSRGFPEIEVVGWIEKPPMTAGHTVWCGQRA